MLYEAQREVMKTESRQLVNAKKTGKYTTHCKTKFKSKKFFLKRWWSLLFYVHVKLYVFDESAEITRERTWLIVILKWHPSTVRFRRNLWKVQDMSCEKEGMVFKMILVWGKETGLEERGERQMKGWSDWSEGCQTQRGQAVAGGTRWAD